MKNKGTTILSVVAALVTVLCITGPAEAGPLARPNLQSGAPTVVSYQGQVIVDGSAYNGIGYFKFAIVDAEGTTYWSNDGQEPTAGISLTVTAGLFNVLLGDTTLPNMTELTADAFDETECYLRVWFSSDGSTYQLLDPDRRIAAVPYALQAQEAADAAYAAYAANADRLDGQHGSYYQTRVSGACAVGSTVRAINADGTVVCQADALNRAVAPMGNVSSTLDSTGDVGWHTSLTIGVDGLGLISYYDATNDALKVAHCEDLACTSTTVITPDVGIGYLGGYTSVTIGADGLGLVSYYDWTNDALKVAHCNDPACTSAITTTLYSSVFLDRYTSVTIGADGLGLISYYYDDGAHNVLMVAHCNDLACTSATERALTDTTGASGYNSVTTGSDGLPLIGYYSSGDLKAAHCEDLACTSAITTTLDDGGGDDVGRYTSVTIGADGLPLISYYDATNHALKAAHCEDLACTSAITTTLDSTGDVGQHTSVTIGADGLPLISYYDATNHALKVAHCRDLACTSADITTLDSGGMFDVGLYTAVTIGADGLPLISYYDATNGDLKVAHCGSPFCTDYFRRR